MLTEKNSKPGEKNVDKSKNKESQVLLNVYDLTPLNKYTYWFGLGVFHTGIEVQGREYAFGAHDLPVSGIFEIEPRSCPGFAFRSSILLGCTEMSLQEFRTFLKTAASDYHGNTYHLVTKNCNHFTDFVSVKLTGKHTPGWVNRLARLATWCSCILPQTFRVSTVRQLPGCQRRPALCDNATNASSRRVEMEDADQQELLSPLTVPGELALVKESGASSSSDSPRS